MPGTRTGAEYRMCCQLRPSSPPMVQKMNWLTRYSREKRRSADVRPLNSDEMAIPAMTMYKSDVVPREDDSR